MALKHVGRVKTNKKKVVVAYRVVPNDPNNCLIIPTEGLTADEHDALMKAVESDAGQSAYEFGEAMARTQLPDGRNMLAGFHTTGRMQKVETSFIEMTPDHQSSVALDELNRLIAEQKGVSVEDLAIQDTAQPKREVVVDEVELDANPVVATNEVLTDEQLAAQYRSQADTMYKEAKRLREQAEELVPTKKKAKPKTTTSA